MTHDASPPRRATLVEGDGFVLVEGGSRISGWVEEGSTCRACGEPQVYDDDFDAFLCVTCNRWLEPTCSDPGCRYCRGRPARPLPRPAG